MKTGSIIIAFDPGERWTGVAAVLIVGPKDWRAESCVLDGKGDLYRAASLLERIEGQPTVIAEDFKAWPVKHQSWNPMNTARLLGALEYVAARRGSDWSLQPAGDADRELPQLAMGRAIMRWHKRWPADSKWQHAMSAWRVFARYLMDVEPETLRRFISVREEELRHPPVDFDWTRQSSDLVAPPVRWSWR